MTMTDVKKGVETPTKKQVKDDDSDGSNKKKKNCARRLGQPVIYAETHNCF